jgi:hypothetical protein
LALIVVVGVGAYMVWQNSQPLVAVVVPGGTATTAAVDDRGTPIGVVVVPGGTETVATVDLGGTATVACASYLQAHPGTPCPLALPQAQTATAVCNQYLGLHPGTPCP